MLIISLFLNAIFLLAIAIIVISIRKTVIEEKCATFAGCMSAITRGLAIQDLEKRFTAVGYGLSELYEHSDDDKEAMKFYLTRASMLRVFRRSAMADMGENVRALALQISNEDDEPGSEMLEYISKASAGDAEPREVWDETQLAAANFVAERKALNIYRKQVISKPIKIFH